MRERVGEFENVKAAPYLLLNVAFPDYYFPFDMRNPDNRNWIYALGKEFYERGNRERVCDISIDEVQMLEMFYDHEYGSNPRYLQMTECREAVRRLLFGGKK